jgi:hypothetical protein
MTPRFSATSFIIGTMVGVVLAGAWFFSDNAALSFGPSFPLSSTSTASSTQESDAISITSQKAGTIVIVESVTVPPPGVWVTVREVQGSTLGNVLGATHIGGPVSQASITLLRATEPNRPYAVELYRDDNEGNFDPAKNSVYIDFDTGAAVIARFTTSE